MAIIARDHADTCLHRYGRHSILMHKLKRVVTEKLFEVFERRLNFR